MFFYFGQGFSSDFSIFNFVSKHHFQIIVQFFIETSLTKSPFLIVAGFAKFNRIKEVPCFNCKYSLD